MLVEDDQDAAEVMTAFLRKAGHRVMSVSNGLDAIALLCLQQDMDVVVTDLRMPAMDGLKLLAEIRSCARWQSLPVIVFSALPGAGDDPRLRVLGVCEVLLKGSALPTDLVAAVARQLPPAAVN